MNTNPPPRFAQAPPLSRGQARNAAIRPGIGRWAALLMAAPLAVAQIDRPGPMQSGQHAKPIDTATVPSVPAGEPRNVAPNDVNKLFATSCGWCHFGGGRDAGKGPKLMNSELTDTELMSRIRNGKVGQMPAFKGQLTEDQIKAIVLYIRDLKPDK